jgi:hypothetical protein
MIRDLRYSRRSVSPKGSRNTPRAGTNELPPLSDYVPLEAAVRFLVDRYLTPRDALGKPVLCVDAAANARVLQRVEARDIPPSIFDSLLLDAELTVLPLFSTFLEQSPAFLRNEGSRKEVTSLDAKKSRHAKKLSDIY